MRRLSQQDAAQIAGERRPLAHRKHPGLFAWVGLHRGYVAGGENVGVRHRLQSVIEADEAVRIHRKPGVRRPARRRGVGHPEYFFEFMCAAVLTAEAVFPQPGHTA